MKVAFWVDPHVDKLKKLLGEETSLQLSRKLLLAQLKETQKIGAKHAIILGDLFDGPFPSIDAMGVVIDVLSHANDIQFVAILGNHDVYDATTNSFRLLAKLPKAGALTNVKFITKATTLKWAKLNIMVLPFGDKPKNVSDIDLIVFHDQVVGAKNFDGPDVGLGQGIPPARFEDCLSVGGDNHLQQQVGKNIYYPGVLAPMTFGEKGKKYFAYLTTEDLKYHIYEIDPPWNLETVRWSDSVKCDEPDTYYKMLITEERPPARWLVEHPQVVKIDGGSKKKQKEAASKIVSLIKPNTDSMPLGKWLKTFTALDKLSITQALKIDEKLK